MTPAQHIALVEVGNEFYRSLGKLTAECLAKLPHEMQDDALAYLQDKCSVYGSNYNKYLKNLPRK